MVTMISKAVQALGVLLIGIAVLTGTGRLINGLPTSNTITVSGKATRPITPNQSVLSGTWEESGKTSEEASRKTAEVANKGLEALKSSGIDQKKITTTQVSVFPEYDYTIMPARSKATGYRASTTHEVKLDDVAKAQEIIDLMTKNGADSTQGPALGLTTATRDQLEKELRSEAIIDARTQAETLAKQAGSRIGKVVSINPTSNGVGPMDYATMALQGSAPEKARGVSDIAVGEKEIIATVSVTYRLR